MTVDESFRKPGAVPFKWEIRPGVPKLQDPPSLDNYQFEFKLRKHHQSKHHQKQYPVSPLPDTPTRLKPPPAGLSFRSEPPTAGLSFRSEPPTKSFRWGSNRFGIAMPDVVFSAGCFPSPVVRRKPVKKGTGNPVSRFEPGYYSDLEIGSSSRWSFSSRKSVSVSPLSYSHRASPQLNGDADWAGFGLF